MRRFCRAFLNNKAVDEREQMEMFRIEHYMYWFTFWALLISIFVQLIFLDASFRQVAGEWAVFLLTAAGLMIGELAGGHFDYNTVAGCRRG